MEGLTWEVVVGTWAFVVIAVILVFDVSFVEDDDGEA
jgi:hypothetical protein